MIVRTSRRNFCAAILNTVTNMLGPLTQRRSRASVWPGTGGWSFAADPDPSPTRRPAIWEPSVAAAILQLRPDPSASRGCDARTIVGDAAIVGQHTEGAQLHIVLASSGRRHRLTIIGNPLDAEPLAYILPTDSFWELRRAAMSAFHEQIHLGLLRPRPACLDPGRSERWRLVQWLRLLDALPEGVSARDLAVELIARDARRYSAAEWDGSSERKRIARWQRQALAVRDGGYLRLLNGQ